MRALRELLSEVMALNAPELLDTDIRAVTEDSRAIQPGDLFIARVGSATDGHAYIPQAVAQGARAVVCERLPDAPDPRVVWIQTKDAAHAAARIAAAWYDYPDRELRLVGVTGTNGKTTTATFLYQLFQRLEERAGLLSTIALRIGSFVAPSRLTTPDPFTLYAAFRQMVNAGCRHAFMEVSSHALDQRRVAGVRFAGAVFTNITHDHLDYHGTFANYLKAKQKLFDMLSPDAWALTNLDDRNGEIITQNTRAHRLTYALKRPADFKARLLEQSLEGMALEIEDRQVWTQLLGDYNACNLLAVYAAARLLGVDEEDALLALSALQPVDGRFQTMRFEDDILAVVDYAHTPDALENLMRAVNDLKTGPGRIILLAGAGGNRDPQKRPIMGKIAAETAQIAILTSDNPRDEDPQQILNEMYRGAPLAVRDRVVMIENRAEAIRYAVGIARPRDVIVVAGKGHETYQEIRGARFPFDDRVHLQAAFDERNR